MDVYIYICFPCRNVYRGHGKLYFIGQIGHESEYHLEEIAQFNLLLNLKEHDDRSGARIDNRYAIPLYL